MCETRTPASFWQGAGILDLSGLPNSGKGKPVFGMVCYESGEVELFYPDIKEGNEVVKPIAVDEACQRLPFISSSRRDYQAFSIPPSASIESALLVAASTYPGGKVAIGLPPLPWPPVW